MEPFRLDVPLLYRPGTPIESVSARCSEILRRIDQLAPVVGKKIILKLHLHCLEVSVFSFLKSTFFTKEGDAFTAEILARYVGFTAARMVFKEDRDFVSRFLAEVRKTPYRRANMETVYAAYEALTGGELLGVMRRTLADAGKSAASPPAEPPEGE